MARFINHIKRSVIVWSLVAYCVGAIFGVIGMEVEKRNVRLHGTSYTNYEFEYWTLLALPGDTIVQRRLGRDSQLGEISSRYTKDVVFQNAKIYGLTFFVLGVIMRLHKKLTEQDVALDS